MKLLFSTLLFISTLFANPSFSTKEQSVFGQSEQNIETVHDKEIQSVEEEAIVETNFTSESLNQNVIKSDEQLKEIIQKEENNNLNSPVEIVAPTTAEELIAQSVEEISNDEEESISDLYEEGELIVDYFSEVEFENQSRAKTLYLSYPHYPKKVYKNQRFKIVVKALVTTDDFYKVETRFIDAKNMTVLNPSNVWTLKDNNTFENTYYFKAYDEDFIMPTLQVLLYKNGEIAEVEYIKPAEMTFTEIAKDDEKFSSIIASDLIINAYKTKQYNNNELITILDVSAKESNLEDFYLRYVQEQGFSKIEDNYPEQQMLYYLVLPVHNKKIEFNYYNSNEKRFKKVVIPIVLENELISTQTDLNPNNSNLLFYKKVALGILAGVLLVLFVWKRNYIYLIVLLITLIIFILYMMPNKQAYVKADTTIYILPTKNSTIFYKTQKANMVQVAMKKSGFAKIIMNVNNKKIIGWIKEDKLVKN